MTSLYGVTRYFDWEYLERILYPGLPPTSPDDCSVGCRGEGEATACQGANKGNEAKPEPTGGLAVWLKDQRPMWWALFQKAQLSYLFSNDLLMRTIFLPPESRIAELQMHRWDLERLRRQLSMLILDRPVPPEFLRRSWSFKLFTVMQYTPVYIKSWDGKRFFFHDVRAEILGSYRVSPTYQVNIGSVPYAAKNAYHYVHLLSDVPSLDCTLGVYAQ